MAFSVTRKPPGGSPIRLSMLRAVARGRDSERELVAGLGARLGGAQVTLHASGREAMRVALFLLAQRSGRDEVLVPAYTCYSIPAAAVAAGLRVRLVDVTPSGGVDPAALACLPLDRAVALVVSNLFGVPEPTEQLSRCLADAGVAMVDDAAQALGGRSPEGPVGARGELGVLSFGRGKPLSALGGGGLVWPDGAELAPAQAVPQRGLALARALAFDVALHPAIFRWLAAIPALRIGETRFDPAFNQGEIDGAALCLAAAALARFDEETGLRAARAARLSERLAAETAFVPVRAQGVAKGVYPRLGVLAPSRQARLAAIADLQDLGVAAMYPDSLDCVPELRPHLAGDSDCPTARAFADRVLTLPTNGGLRENAETRLFAALGRLS